ncbi:CBS domain-containing protein [Cupriavidus malaysiensis]|uniref:CBS domain-containing protein n=2 Tax=Cupriavidus malaysiensis TaxID=367825 RepID=A0ABM6FFD0_9BURK|nr:CBS domain-containing protein [Cupriavidus malaysiensis]
MQEALSQDGSGPCVADAMTRDPAYLAAEDTVRHAAELMADLQVGALPVCVGRRLVGMLTDRDIAIRCVACGKPAETTSVAEAMSGALQWCSASDTLATAARMMAQAQVRRLPVIDADHQLIGILSLGDLATRPAVETDSGQALARISSPSTRAR